MEINDLRSVSIEIPNQDYEKLYDLENFGQNDSISLYESNRTNRLEPYLKKISAAFSYCKSWFVRNESAVTVIEEEKALLPLSQNLENISDVNEENIIHFSEEFENTMSKKDLDKLLSLTISQRTTEKALNPNSKTDRPIDIVIGILKGKLYYVTSDELRPIPASKRVQFFVGCTLLASLTGSYRIFNEGIVTKGLAAASTAFLLPKIGKIPYVPKILGPAAFTTGLYLAERLLFPNNFFIKFGAMFGAVLCANLYKRGGKALAKGGWAAFKEYVFPPGLREDMCLKKQESPKSLKDGYVFKTLEITPLLSNPETKKPELEFKVFDGDVYYNLKIGEKKFPEVRMASSNDDDEEEEEEEKVKKKGKNESKETKKTKEKKKSGKVKKGELTDTKKNLKKTALIGSAFVATILSRLYLDKGTEGIITGAFNTIFSASVKAELRQQSWAFSYIPLGISSLFLTLIKVLRPNFFLGNYAFMPLSVLISMLNKDFVKDTIVVGKRTKNWQTKWNEPPLWMQKLASKYFPGYKMSSNKIKGHPFQALIAKENEGKFPLILNAASISKNNPELILINELTISGERLKGSSYKKVEKYENPTEIQPKKKDEIKNLKWTQFNDNEIENLGLTERTNEGIVKVKLTKLQGKEIKKLELARVKGKKLGKWAEYCFLGTSGCATIGSSYLTRKLMNSNTSKPGEGVVTAILNSILATYMKQVGKKIPLATLDGSLIFISSVCLVGEYYLIKCDKLPFGFAFIPTSIFLGMLGKRAKNWVFEKQWNQSEGYITKTWPTEEQIKNWFTKRISEGKMEIAPEENK